MLLAEYPDSLFQVFSACENTALIGDRRADLAGPRPAMEIPVYVPFAERRHSPFHSYLPPQSFPVEAQGRPRVIGEFQAFPAFRVGKEAEAVRAYALCQHHAHAWRAIPGGRGESGRIGIVGFAFLSLLQPGIEPFQRIFRGDFMRIHSQILDRYRKPGYGNRAAVAARAVVTRFLRRAVREAPPPRINRGSLDRPAARRPDMTRRTCWRDAQWGWARPPEL